MKPNHQVERPRPTRREFVILSCACLTALLSVILLLPQFKASSQQGPQRERLIDTKGSYADCPIKIVGVETNKRKVVLGKSFLDDDDWMKGLTVRVVNSSGKSLSHIGIRLDFERPADQAAQPGAVWDLWYGVSPFHFKPDEIIPPPLNPLIQPGAVQSIALTDSEYGYMRAFLWDFKFPASIENVHITVYTIGFTDGTAWGGQLYRRERGSKQGWKPAEKPKGSARNRAVFLSPFLLASYKKDVPIEWKTGSSVDWFKSGPLLGMKPAPDFVQCGSALIASDRCPNQPSICVFDNVTQLDPDDPNKRDAVASRGGPMLCIIQWSKGLWLRQRGFSTDQSCLSDADPYTRHLRRRLVVGL